MLGPALGASFPSLSEAALAAMAWECAQAPCTHTTGPAAAAQELWPPRISKASLDEVAAGLPLVREDLQPMLCCPFAVDAACPPGLQLLLNPVPVRCCNPGAQRAQALWLCGPA